MKVSVLPSTQLVPDDLALLEAGVVVRADVRFIEVYRPKIEEVALTGESIPVEKVAALSNEDIPLGNKLNMAYKGIAVACGRWRDPVVNTGVKTKIGRIAKRVQEEQELKTPLQKRLAVPWITHSPALHLYPLDQSGYRQPSWSGRGCRARGNGYDEGAS